MYLVAVYKNRLDCVVASADFEEILERFFQFFPSFSISRKSPVRAMVLF